MVMWEVFIGAPYTFESCPSLLINHFFYSIQLFIYPSVALSDGLISAGFPITIELSGTSIFTNAPGAIRTLFPILIFPTMTALGPIHTLFPIMEILFVFLDLIVRWSLLEQYYSFFQL